MLKLWGFYYNYDWGQLWCPSSNGQRRGHCSQAVRKWLSKVTSEFYGLLAIQTLIFWVSVLQSNHCTTQTMFTKKAQEQLRCIRYCRIWCYTGRHLIWGVVHVGVCACGCLHTGKNTHLQTHIKWMFFWDLFWLQYLLSSKWMFKIIAFFANKCIQNSHCFVNIGISCWNE